MSLDDMLVLVRKRTKVTNDDDWLVRELNDAQDWAWQRIYVTNPDIQLTFGTTGTLAADATSLDLSTAVSSTIWGLKTFWFKGAADTTYVPAVLKDENDPAFLALDVLTPAQIIQPVIVALTNFNVLRFANNIISGTQWQADWIGEPPALSLNTNAANTSFPRVSHMAVVARAIAVIYDSIDDTRAQEWFNLSTARLSSAIHALKRRQFLTKSSTKPYPSRSGGLGFRPHP